MVRKSHITQGSTLSRMSETMNTDDSLICETDQEQVRIERVEELPPCRQSRPVGSFNEKDVFECRRSEIDWVLSDG